MIEIDGTSGGGQMLRTSISLSAITGKPVKITNIRKARARPDLKAQHLTAINAAGQMCNAKIVGNKLHSKEVEFTPGEIKSGTYKLSVGTAGAVTLVLQTLVPIAAFGKQESVFEIIGGTDVAWSPSIHYFMHVFSNYMKQIGLRINTHVKHHGFYPKGGGEVHVTVWPWKTKKPYIHFKQGKYKYADVWSIASEVLKKPDVAKRQVKGFEQYFKDKIKNSSAEYFSSLSVGSDINAHAHYANCKLGASSLGERRKAAEKVGKDCALSLAAEMRSGATADHRMADQIMLYLAFTGGKFKTSRITNHIRTNAKVIEAFMNVKININDKINIIEVLV